MRIQHLIDGQSVESRDCFETVNPATQEVLAEVAAGGAEEVNAAVAAAKAAFPKWAALPAAERAKVMVSLGDLIVEHVPEIAQIETRDTGQTISQTAKQLIPRAADNFYYFAEMCTRVDGHTYPTSTHLNYTLYHPVGVCALISPWNVPFMTGTWKIEPCLAFGNTAVLKMSELSPLSISRLGELSREAGLPKGVLNIVHSAGRETGEPLCGHPDVRAISFTGSTATGQRIVKYAGLKKFSMELGGKSPFVVFEDANFERALDAAVFMIFSNKGERCAAGSHILVQKSIFAEFAKRFAERASRIKVGDPLNDDTLIGPMISPAHLAKVRSCIELGTPVPMRYMNADPHFKVVYVSGWCIWHELRTSERFGLAVRKAIEEHCDGTVAVFASGSLSHHFAPNGRAPEFMHKVFDPFLEQTDRSGVEMWKRGEWKAFLQMLPMYNEKCWGEGGMHDTAMLLRLLGGERYDRGVEIVTPYFGSSGTGQLNAIFPVTPLAA